MVSILTSASLATLPIVSIALSRVGALDAFRRSCCFTLCRPFVLFITDGIMCCFHALLRRAWQQIRGPLPAIAHTRRRAGQGPAQPPPPPLPAVAVQLPTVVSY